MIGTIRKHQAWLWVLIIAAVIVSFVIYFTPGVGSGRSGGGARSTFGTLNGRPITHKQYSAAWWETKLSFFLKYGTWPDQAETRKFGFNLEKETSNRLVLLDRLADLDIKVDEGAMAQWILERFADPKNPSTAKDNYERFVRGELAQRGVKEADFQQFVRHEIGIMHLVAVAGSPGRMTTPRAAANLYRQENEKIAAEAVVFSVTNFLSGVTLDPAQMAQFYTNRQGVYRIPERVQVNYVKFEATNFLAQADEFLAKETNLNAMIDQAYLRSGANFFTDTNGLPMTPEAAKAKIKKDYRERQALLAARKEATIFANELAKLKPVKAENLNNLAAAKGVLSATTEPFGQFEGPKGLKVRENFAETAFKLTSDEPFSSPLVAEDAVYLISLKQRVPSEIPPLDSIRARVLEDFRRDQALRLARQAGTNFVHHLTNGLAQGKTWAAVCAEAKVAPIILPKFSASAREVPEWDKRLNFNQVQAAVPGLADGKPSEFKLTFDGGFVLLVKARVPVAEAELKQELPKFMASLRQSQQVDAFYEWFRKQVELSRIDTVKGKEEEE